MIDNCKLKLTACKECGGLMIDDTKPKAPSQKDLLKAGLSCRKPLDQPLDGEKEEY